MKDLTTHTTTAGGEAGTPADPPAVYRGRYGRRYPVAERKALLGAYATSGESMSVFCARYGVSTASLCKWRKALGERGEAGLTPTTPRRNWQGRTGRVRDPDERRRAVQAYQLSGMTLEQFARTWGVCPGTLRNWLSRVREVGPKGLEPRPRGRPRGARTSIPSIPASTHAEILRTKTRFPEFGFRKVRDFLRRFQGVTVSPGTVRNTLKKAGIPPLPPHGKRRRRKQKTETKPRRFERSKPGELWQSDITSFNLTRHGTKVYLTVFLDDFSRFVVGWNLATHQRQELVNEALMDGISRFGKPKEVLTDQGRQYFSWRGKSDFQKLLVREGIEHVVSRTHHPETLGKCERLWETVGREFWERVRPQDITDARERLGHWIAHYNYFRPHQGIDGLVPADRFFGAQEALRKTHEARLEKSPLDAALSDAPRKGVYLFGQIGDEQVSMVGERGELVVQTSSGVRQRIGLDELGLPQTAALTKEVQIGDGRAGAGGSVDVGAGNETASIADGQETDEVCSTGEVPSRSEGAVDECLDGGAVAGAPLVHADPLDVAWEATSRGGGSGTVDSAAACVAAQPAGAGRDAGGAVASTEVASRTRGGSDGHEGRESFVSQEADRGAGGGALELQGSAEAPDGAASSERCVDSVDVVGAGDADAAAENARSSGGPST